MKKLLFLIGWVTILLGNGWEDYFHTAAYYYTKGQIKEAGIVLNDGLQLYPDNSRLQALKGLLAKEEEKNKQENQSSENQSEERQDQKQQDQQNSEQQQNQDQSESEQERKQDEGQDKQDQKDQSGQAEKQDEKPGEEAESDGKEDEKKALEKQNAAAILDALKNDEKIHQKRIISRKSSRKLEKDW